jgi:hypothetical protein
MREKMNTQDIGGKVLLVQHTTAHPLNPTGAAEFDNVRLSYVHIY